MAYRRRQGVARDSTYKEDLIETPSPRPYVYHPQPQPPIAPLDDSPSPSSASSLAAKAIMASSAYRDSSLSSAYGQSALSPRGSSPAGSSSPSSLKDSTTRKYTSLKGLDEPKQGFWGVLARKAKAVVEDDNAAQQFETPGRLRQKPSDTETRGQYYTPNQSHEGRRKADNPALHKGLDAIASSFNYIGGTIGNALEEGLTIVENRTADIIQETRRLQIRKKGNSPEVRNQASNVRNQASTARDIRQPPVMQTQVQPQTQTDLETQLKASRDVAMAMAAKAKLLLRELKTVKADLAFAKERCAQLEEENKILRESRGKGHNLEDDDLIRLQLETLLAEKARLAQENSVFARENRFLREIVEYHQLTMQDVVYLDEGSEEVTEVYPIKIPSATNLQSLNTTTSLPPILTPPSGAAPSANPQVVPPPHRPSSESVDVSREVTPLSPYIHITEDEHPERH